MYANGFNTFLFAQRAVNANRHQAKIISKLMVISRLLPPSRPHRPSKNTEVSQLWIWLLFCFVVGFLSRIFSSNSLEAIAIY